MDFRICWTHCTAGPKRGCLRLIMTNLKLCTFESVRRREHNLNSHMVIPHLTSCICIDTWDWTCMNTWTSQKALSVWPQPQAELWAQWLTNTIRPTGWITLLTRNSMTRWCPQSWTTVVRSGLERNTIAVILSNTALWGLSFVSGNVPRCLWCMVTWSGSHQKYARKQPWSAIGSSWPECPIPDSPDGCLIGTTVVLVPEHGVMTSNRYLRPVIWVGHTKKNHVIVD